MDMLLPPEGDVIAEHAATLGNRIAAVLFLVLPGAGLAFLATQVPEARPAALLTAVVLVALGVLAVVQQNKVRVVMRTDGLERWGLRGKLWSLRWQDMTELHYRVIKMRLYHVIPIATYTYLHFVDPGGKKRKAPMNLKAMDVFSERVIEQQTTARFAEARTRLDAGEEVKFGKHAVLAPDRISVRKLFGGYKSCALADIEKVSVEGGVLRILQRGKTFAFARLNTHAIPNVFLLLRMLDALVAQKPAALGGDRDFAGRASVG